MPAVLREADAIEIDDFLAEEKHLVGTEPLWQDSSRESELSAVWNIQDSLGITKAHLRFRCPKAWRDWPSVSVIFRNYPIWRLDLVAPTICKHNPLGAHSLGLSAVVCGSHCHTWYDNRSHLLTQDLWVLPYRRPLDGPVRRLPQAIASLADAINLALESHQRGFDVPPQSDLFEGR
jgi:hypothetical protein